jgi:hypothetical protein
MLCEVRSWSHTKHVVYALLPSAHAALISNSGIGSTMGQVIYGRIVSGAGGAGMTALVSIVIAGMLLHMLTYLDLD